MPKEKSGDTEQKMYSVCFWIDSNQKKAAEMAYLNSGATSKGAFYSDMLHRYCEKINYAMRKVGK